MSGEEADGAESRAAEASLGELERRLETQREEYLELVEDVRERVIQVKREADGKAAADHDHPELADARADVERMAGTVDELEAGVEDLRSDLESGFENYEDVLRYLTDMAEETERNLDALAQAVVSLRETTRSVAGAETAREEADRLKLAANRKGVAKGDCEDCGQPIRVGLLSRPECPHCATPLVDVEPASGFFGSATVVTGSQPQLEGEVDVGDEDLSAMVEEGDAPTVDLAPDDEAEEGEDDD